MAKAGLTPQQVLAAATRDAARCMKIDSEVGTLEPGKWADFVVLDADPLADIANTKKIDRSRSRETEWHGKRDGRYGDRVIWRLSRTAFGREGDRVI